MRETVGLIFSLASSLTLYIRVDDVDGKGDHGAEEENDQNGDDGALPVAALHVHRRQFLVR